MGDLRMFMDPLSTGAENVYRRPYKIVKVNGGAYHPYYPGNITTNGVQYAVDMSTSIPLIFSSVGGDAVVELPNDQ